MTKNVTSLYGLPSSVKKRMLINGLLRDLDEGVDESLVRMRAKSKGIIFDDLIYLAIPFLKRFD